MLRLAVPRPVLGSGAEYEPPKIAAVITVPPSLVSIVPFVTVPEALVWKAPALANRLPPRSTPLAPKAKLLAASGTIVCGLIAPEAYSCGLEGSLDRKSTRLNSSHLGISYAV